MGLYHSFEPAATRGAGTAAFGIAVTGMGASRQVSDFQCLGSRMQPFVGWMAWLTETCVSLATIDRDQAVFTHFWESSSLLERHFWPR